MHRFRKIAYLIVGLATAGAFAVACDSGTQEPAAPDNAGTPLTADGSSTRPPDVIPESRYPIDLPADVDAGIPDIFPDEVPIYPGSVPAQGKGTEVEGVPIAAVQLMTLDSTEDVYDFYFDKFTNEGWTIEEREGFAEKSAISATKGKCKVTILAAPAEEGNGANIFIVTEC
jgi:hypothetical protein